MGIDLPLIWAVIIAFGVMMYVVMDGFDLGIGILFPFVRDDGERDVMMNTVAPVWDGNETWLVLGGGVVGLLVVPGLAGIKNLGRHARARGRNPQAEDRVGDGLDFVEISVEGSI